MIDSRRRRMELFLDGMKQLLGMSQWKLCQRSVFFEGSFCYSSQPIPHLTPDKLPLPLYTNTETGDAMTVTHVSAFTPPTCLQATSAKKQDDELSIDRRCKDCTKAFPDVTALLSHCQITGHQPVSDAISSTVEATPATNENFLAFCNIALQRAMEERMARWGRDYIDPKSQQSRVDKRSGRPLGVDTYRAFSCEFGLSRTSFTGPLHLCLTVDLKAKVIRTKSLLHNLADMCNSSNLDNINYTPSVIKSAQRQFKGEVVICRYDKRCYSVVDLLFEHSANSLPIPDTKMSHADYFSKKKKLKLEHPKATPMVAVLGRNNSVIYLPPEMVCMNDLDPLMKMQLPLIASYPPKERSDAIDEMKRYLVPRAQKTKGVGGGLLPAVGIVLKDARLKVKVDCLPLPVMKAAGVLIPKEKGAMWAPAIAKANYKVPSSQVLSLNVYLVVHRDLDKSAGTLYNRVRDLVNGFNASYKFKDKPYKHITVNPDDRHHWGSVEKNMSGNVPNNVFVLDFTKPRNTDSAYSVIKHMLAQTGYLSQFVNFKNYDHARNMNERKSFTILQGVARQILSKCGVRVWWVQIPRSIPVPCVMVGIDVYHAPRKYDPVQKKRMAKESVAAIIVQVFRSHNETTKMEIYSETQRRKAGQEMDLGSFMHSVVSNALRVLKVHPMSCVVWRDGVGDGSIRTVTNQEIPQVRQALKNAHAPVGSKAPAKNIPLSYMVVQKRINTKFLSLDGNAALPCGALVTSLQGAEHATFYINGNAPPYSTPKPARFVITSMDAGFGPSKKVISDLSWAMCHDYPNWTGPIKLPSPVQMAHKLAELAGSFSDCGDTIDAKAYSNKVYFL